MVKFKELSWCLGETPSLGVTSVGLNEYYLFASLDGRGACWGVNHPKRMHLNGWRSAFQVYDIDLATLMDVNVTLEDIKKKDIKDIDVFETAELANEAGSWVKDPKLREMIPLFDPMRKGMYLHYRKEPKQSLAYNLNHCFINKIEPIGEDKDEIEWLKSYLNAQKIPFEIKKQTFEGASHLDRIKVE